MKGKYDDIMDLPHHVSATRAHMSPSDRAAQFSPFAALTGFGAAITETGRLTQQRIELDEDEKQAINEKLVLLCRQSAERSPVSVTYYEPDEKKAGGAYVTADGILKKVDGYARAVIFTDGRRIPIDDVIGIYEDGIPES